MLISMLLWTVKKRCMSLRDQKRSSSQVLFLLEKEDWNELSYE